MFILQCIRHVKYMRIYILQCIRHVKYVRIYNIFLLGKVLLRFTRLTKKIGGTDNSLRIGVGLSQAMITKVKGLARRHKKSTEIVPEFCSVKKSRNQEQVYIVMVADLYLSDNKLRSNMLLPSSLIF